MDTMVEDGGRMGGGVLTICSWVFGLGQSVLNYSWLTPFLVIHLRWFSCYFSRRPFSSRLVLFYALTLLNDSFV